ncbi:MAG: hypothetical protein MMC23_009946 [Stictis urceolatum]|nr:hypothetical protein [Stictis urceolata]
MSGSGAIRHGATTSGAQPYSPHTPQRPISSTFSSPGVGFRSEDDHVVLQIGSRFLLGGFAGDTKPRCIIPFGQDDSRRVGDYRKWLPGHESRSGPRIPATSWGSNHELWRMDTRALDLDLVEDRLEWAIREAYTRFLLLDTKSRKVLLVLPSVLPHPLINSVLGTLFGNFQVPNIVMLPIPLLSVLAAGQRSGMVVDIGWHETVVTSVYELRETRQSRTTRAMRLLSLKTAQLLNEIFKGSKEASPAPGSGETTITDEKICLDFGYVEDITSRLSWCNCDRKSGMHESRSRNGVQAGDDGRSSGRAEPTNLNITKPESPKIFKVPIKTFSIPTESSLILHSDMQQDQDDEELSLPFILYESLRALPADVRGICMSNLVFVGGGSNIPGLKSRIMFELSELIDLRGWDPVWGQKGRKQNSTLNERKSDGFPITRPLLDQDRGRIQRGGDQPQVLHKEASDSAKITVQASGIGTNDIARSREIRSAKTLGPWAGASVAAAMRLRSAVEVERETFLQAGMAGARNVRDIDISAARSRQSLGPGLVRAGVLEGAPWTLGSWA